MSSTVVSAPPSPVAVSVPRPEVGPAIALGWSMAELYRAPIPIGPDDDANPPDRLPGVSTLRPRDRFVMGLLQIDVALDEIGSSSGFRWAGSVTPPSTASTRAAFQATLVDGARLSDRRALHGAIAQLHVDLLGALTASDEEMGKAYGLGRALADTCRRSQTSDQLVESFEPGRIHEIVGWIVDLTSVLPRHAGHSVAASVERWTQQVHQPIASRLPSHRRRAIGATRNPPLAPFTGVPAPTAAVPTTPSAQAAAPGLNSMSYRQLATAVHRQGQLWRSLLTGEKKATDLLMPKDYVDAAQRLAHSVTPLARRIVRNLAVPLAVLIGSAVVLIAIAVALRGPATTRLAASLVAAGGALGGSWRMVSPRAARLLSLVEEPLWGAELDAAIAEAVTIPPVGSGDPVGVLALAEAALAGFIDLTGSQPAGPSAVAAPATGPASEAQKAPEPQESQ